MTTWYNENDPYAAQWLRNLIADGHIAPGIVDGRPIQEIEAFELAGFTQCHFFAGIGIWSYALRQAGWADDRPIWTGSCPCQPFSAAGKQKGFSDERHLWPYWEKLIGQREPSVIVGEQVASALEWLDLVSTDLENSGYAFGASDLCAAGFDGAHIRQRNYFVGLADNAREFDNGSGIAGPGRRLEHSISGAISGLADDDDARSQGWGLRGNGANQCAPRPSSVVSGLADDGSSRREMALLNNESCGASGGERQTNKFGMCEPVSGSTTDAPMLGRTPVDWLFCRDGKWRPVESGTFPLVNEAPARVGRLRAYGNALDAQTAIEFCGAVKEICDGV